MFQNLIVARHAGRNHLRHAPSNDFPRHRFFELLTYRHSKARPHETRQIRVHGMVRKTRQFGIMPTIVSARERDAEDARSRDGIFAKSFVKITDSEQQKGIGILRFGGVILPHEWR